MNEKILEELYKPFNLKARKGPGGKTFQYAPTSDVVDRMNKTFKGDWSTEVRSSEIIEDQVLICVRIYVKDPSGNISDSHSYWHEGYSSQHLARYTFGEKKGQIIDLGNSYRSAMSKAIKAACAKWGVGLYLDKDELSDGEDFPSGNPNPSPSNDPIPDNPGPKAQPESNQDNPIMPPGPPMGGPIRENPPKPQETGTSPSMSSPPTEVSPPVFTNEKVISSNPDPTGPPVETMLQDEHNSEYLTPVQKVAIETIMGVHTLDFPTLVDRALERTSDIPEALEKVKYQDAVTLIQYGNNLKVVSI